MAPVCGRTSSPTRSPSTPVLRPCTHSPLRCAVATARAFSAAALTVPPRAPEKPRALPAAVGELEVPAACDRRRGRGTPSRRPIPRALGTRRVLSLGGPTSANREKRAPIEARYLFVANRILDDSAPDKSLRRGGRHVHVPPSRAPIARTWWVPLMASPVSRSEPRRERRFRWPPSSRNRHGSRRRGTNPPSTSVLCAGRMTLRM